MKIVIACFAFILTANLLFAADPVWRVLKADDTTAAEVLNDGNMTVAGSVSAASVSATSVAVGSSALLPVLVNTNANVVLSAIQGSVGQFLLTPNATNNATALTDETYFMRVSVNLNGTTNGWRVILTNDIE